MMMLFKLIEALFVTGYLMLLLKAIKKDIYDESI